MFGLFKKSTPRYTWEPTERYLWKVIASTNKDMKIQRFQEVVAFDAPENEQYKWVPYLDESVFTGHVYPKIKIVPLDTYQVDRNGKVAYGEGDDYEPVNWV